MGNPFVKIQLEGFTNAKDDSNNWTVGMGITLGVSIFFVGNIVMF